MNYEVRKYLIEIARKKVSQTVTYQRLCDDCNLKLDMSDISHRNEIATILDEISTFEHTNERPLLSALVIRLDDSREGDGFYKMAERLGFGNWKKLKSKITFEAEQISDCIKKWQNDKFYLKNK